MERYNLEFKWGVSKGCNTYGYTICSLYVNGYKKASCNGGGYDMKGTALGNWIASRFADELVKLDIPIEWHNGKEEQMFYGLTFHDPDFDPGKAIVEHPHFESDKGKTVEQLEEEGKSLGLERYQQFYKASSKVPTERHTVPLIDGACGFSSIEKIIRALGFELFFVSESSKLDVYVMERK